MSQPSCPNACCYTDSGTVPKVVPHGFFRVQCGRRRRYRCHGCGGTFSRRAGTAYFRLRCSSRTFDRVAHLSVEGMSRTAIARVEDVSWNAADRWVSRAAAYAGQFNDCNTRGCELTELQADELKTFAPSKRHPAWVFTCMEVCSRLWTSTVVGRRSYRNTHAFLNDTLARGDWVRPPLIMTDGFQYYVRVIAQLFGVACVYAQVIKTW